MPPKTLSATTETSTTLTQQSNETPHLPKNENEKLATIGKLDRLPSAREIIGESSAAQSQNKQHDLRKRNRFTFSMSHFPQVTKRDSNKSWLSGRSVQTRFIAWRKNLSIRTFCPVHRTKKKRYKLNFIKVMYSYNTRIPI